jgi:hypothetical protein
MVLNNSAVYQGSVGADFTRQTAGYLGPAAATVGPEYGMLRPATRGGDLVLPHAIGVHGLVLLAVPFVLLARTAVPQPRQLLLSAAAVASVGLAVAVLLVHALRQLPLRELHSLALGMLIRCAAALLAAYTGVAVALLRRGGTRPGRT